MHLHQPVRQPMTEPLPDWPAYIAAMGPVVGLNIRDDWKPSVADCLAMAAAAAALFVGFPLDDANDEAAPIFRPGARA